MTPDIESFDHVHVFVEDRQAAERWYADVLGLSRSKELEFWAPDRGPLTLQNRSGSVHIALFERPRQPCRSTIALRVGAAEFLAWRRHLRSALGREMVPEDHQASWSLYFDDPDGNPFEITTYDYAAVAASGGGA